MNLNSQTMLITRPKNGIGLCMAEVLLSRR